MIISYKWLGEYLPFSIEPERLSKILTSIGLEVESFEKYEEIKGGLEGLVIGEVLSVEKHPNADKLTIANVSIENGEPLQIVCGAPNVATGQKVIVAPVGTTIYPVNKDPLTMKVAKIRNVESHGMIVAEDEVGLGTSHEGIIVLPADVKTGTPAADFFKPYTDWIYEIGLTPNRMDAMSHWGVARDVCAYMSYHDKKDYKPKITGANGFKIDDNSLVVDVKIENSIACPRYSGISISGIEIKESPKWLQQKLKSIGHRPINNIVDITNYIQHETGQPLHAFDADRLAGKKIVVKNLAEGTKFITLDEKERKLNANDLMICDGKEGICIAGVFGGLHSGVSEKTKNIFLESACFDQVSIRKTSLRHGLRTDAATRFEKGTDISVTVTVLKRTAALIKEICGGKISSEVVDIYPQPKVKKQVLMKYHYLKKLSGRNYHPDAIKNILTSLGFEMVKDGIDDITVTVPFHKTDISLPADLVEEILRIDGLDNIQIPGSITISPAIETNYTEDAAREKVANYLIGLGFHEIMTNSISNSAYYGEEDQDTSIKMINNLSAELNIMRPSMLETGLETIAYNLNRKNNDLKFFEFGKIYHVFEEGKYYEPEKLCLYITGQRNESHWKHEDEKTDFFYLKGVVEKILEAIGTDAPVSYPSEEDRFDAGMIFELLDVGVAYFGVVSNRILRKFDIKQPVLFVEIDWDYLMKVIPGKRLTVFREIPRFPSVHRDLAIIVDSSLPYSKVQEAVQKTMLKHLQEVKLFDIFESEKIGAGKKSLAISFTFMNEEKTLTDKEIEEWMKIIMAALEKDLSAEIRK